MVRGSELCWRNGSANIGSNAQYCLNVKIRDDRVKSGDSNYAAIDSKAVNEGDTAQISGG